MAEQEDSGRGATVYGLFATDEPGRIRYVGCTESAVRERVWSHRSKAREGRTNRVWVWVRECWARGVDIEAVVLQQDACFADEIAHVARMRAAGVDLLNETDGGKGGSRGLPVTDAQLLARQAPATEKQKTTLRELHQTRSDDMLRGLRANKANPEYLRGHAEKMRAWNASLTPEQKAENVAKMMATRATKTADELAEATRKRLETCSAKTPEERDQTRAKQSAAWASKSLEQQAEIGRRRSAGWAAKTPEQKAEINRKRAEGIRAAAARKRASTARAD